MNVDLRSLFRSAFETFLNVERSNIASGVSERSLCARLAMVLEPAAHEQGLTAYRADVEYNRGRGDKVKVIVDHRYHVMKVTCDLVLHGRGLIQPDNLLAIEMKRHSHAEGDKEDDRVRLRAMTGEAQHLVDYRTGRPVEHVSGYALGYLVELMRGGWFKVEEYAGGRQVGEWRSERPESTGGRRRDARPLEQAADLFGTFPDLELVDRQT